jgi:hypothetical protein
MEELQTKTDSEHDASQTEIASYIAEMVAGLRHISTHREGLRFLDNLLALAEQEAKTMSFRSYN